jgi:hypothetical protein
VKQLSALGRSWHTCVIVEAVLSECWALSQEASANGDGLAKGQSASAGTHGRTDASMHVEMYDDVIDGRRASTAQLRP